MVTTVPTQWDAKSGLALSMLGVPESAYDDAFDSYLLLKPDGVQNHTITLVLKIHLKQPETYGFKVFPVLDSDGNLFWQRPWQPHQWEIFKTNFKRQAYRWNDQFWLVPPAGFSAFDVKQGSKTVRPNFYCHLYIDFVGAGPSAHRTIEVTNLDRASTEKIRGSSKLDSGDFRSNSSHYDSYDTTTRTNESTDETGATSTMKNYSTIAHEIGHALGLPHSGWHHGDPLAKLAVLLDDTPAIIKDNLPAILKGGTNSQVCYGHYGPPGRAANVMGAGTSFDSFNSWPWLSRLALHTNTQTTDWEVVLKHKPSPKQV